VSLPAGPIPSVPVRRSPGNIGGRAIAGGGALLFAAALGYFLYTYALTFGERQHAAMGDSPVSTQVEAIAWDLTLFTVFALHHSVFARVRVRAFIARTVPVSLERSVYVWVASTLLIIVCTAGQPVAGTAWAIPRWLGYAVMGVGIVLTLFSARVIDVWELAGIRQARSPQPDARSLVFKSSGPYGYVRHPIYSAWFLMVFGVPVMTGTRLVFALVSGAYLLIGIVFEERTLRRTTGGAYDAYIRRVPWKLVPGIY
jgi:protein-S-isoprenylcysteine O-methyltransferase Ste14